MAYSERRAVGPLRLQWPRATFQQWTKSWSPPTLSWRQLYEDRGIAVVHLSEFEPELYQNLRHTLLSAVTWTRGSALQTGCHDLHYGNKGENRPKKGRLISHFQNLLFSRFLGWFVAGYSGAGRSPFIVLSRVTLLCAVGGTSTSSL